MKRWLLAVEQGALFRARPMPSGASVRQRAERVAMTLVSFAPPDIASASLGEQAFAGAEVIAHAA